MVRSITLALALLAVTAAPAGAVRSTPLREVARAEVSPYNAVLESDGERYVSYVPEGTRSTRVHDTRTGATHDVPGCRLLTGSKGLFIAVCGDRFDSSSGGRDFYDARSRRLVPIRGRAENDRFRWIGEHWVEGEDVTPCEPKCSMVIVWVNRKTGKRVRCFDDYERCGRDLNTPSGRFRPRERLTYVRHSDNSLILRERGRGDARLSAPGACGDESGYCNPRLLRGRLSWSESDRPGGIRAHVRGFDLTTRRWAAWKVPRAPSCAGSGALRARHTHTRSSMWLTGLFPARASDRTACRSVPIYAADWPGGR